MLKKINRFLNDFERPRSKSLNSKQSLDSVIAMVNLIAHWERIVGKSLVKVTLPQRIAKKNLYIVMNHPSYGQHLKLLQQDILKKIHDTFPPLRSEFDNLKFFFSEEAFKVQETKRVRVRKEEVKDLQANTPVNEQFNLHNPQIQKLYIEAQEIYRHTPEGFRDSLISLHIQQHLNSSS